MKIFNLKKIFKKKYKTSFQKINIKWNYPINTFVMPQEY